MGKSAKNILHVPPQLAQQSLGSVLRAWMDDKSWSQLRQLVQSRRIMLDGNLATDLGQRLKAGQVLKLLDAGVTPPATENDIHIRYLDADVVVVEKPSGMTSIRHPDEKAWSSRRRQWQLTLTELLPRLVAKKDRGYTKSTRTRPVRAVHRLDRETSGLMVFARNVKAESFLGHQFRDHSIRRVYWAIVAGQARQQVIETRLVRDRGDGRRGSATGVEAGKKAVTHVTPLEELAGFTLIECRLETGRTHQIRIHLAEAGHPVCGDKVYGQRGRRPPKIAPPRLALHAGRLGFLHPADHRALDFESPLPEDLAGFLDRLRRREGSSS